MPEAIESRHQIPAVVMRPGLNAVTHGAVYAAEVLAARSLEFAEATADC